jgi:colanic acid/amylovoran biosynthesis glycosyltransferase
MHLPHQRTLKIAFLVGEFPALSETFILNQITSLMERGHDVSIFAEREPSQSTVHSDVVRFQLDQRTRYERLPDGVLERIWRLPLVYKWDRPSARALNVVAYGGEAACLRLAWGAHLFHGSPAYDIVQCHFGALGVKAARLQAIGAMRGKIVTAFHGQDVVNYPKQFRGNVYAPLFQRGDLFLPISDRWNGALIAMGCPEDRIRVHRMGVDLRRFPPRQPAVRSPLRIVTVARLVEKKGIDDAIVALSQVNVPFEYEIAGDGPLRGALERLARERAPGKHIRFLGARTHDEIAALLQSADLFLAPSVTGTDGDVEGIPVSIMEAMACGVPVISTLHSGIPELVAHGVSGCLVAEHDVRALSSAVSALAGDPALRARMGAAGRASVEAEYDIARLTDRLVDMYRQLLADPR